MSFIRPACQTSCKTFILLANRDSNSDICEGHEDDDHASMDLDVMPYAKKVFSAKGVEGRGHDVQEFFGVKGLCHIT